MQWTPKKQISLKQKNNIANVLGLRLKILQSIKLWRILWTKEIILVWKHYYQRNNGKPHFREHHGEKNTQRILIQLWGAVWSLKNYFPHLFNLIVRVPQMMAPLWKQTCVLFSGKIKLFFCWKTLLLCIGACKNWGKVNNILKVNRKVMPCINDFYFTWVWLQITIVNNHLNNYRIIQFQIKYR